MKSSIRLPRHDDICHLVDFVPVARRPRRLLVSCTHDSSANKVPSAVKAHRPSQRKSNREPKILCAAKKKKQQFGPSAGVAVPGMLDEEVEAAYKQFGRALGETPRETSKVVRAKYNIPAAPPQQLARGTVGPCGPSERRFTEESYAQFEAMLEGAMKGSGDSQPRALVKGKNTVALQAGERERRKVMMELMESTLSPEAAPFSLDLGLDRIRPTVQKPEEEVPQLILPRGKVAAPAKRPATASAEGTPPTRSGPLPMPALQMPRGKLPKREPPIATAAAPVAPPRPLPTPTIAPKPGLAPPKVDWKITEIDEDYLQAAQDGVVRRPAPPEPGKQSPPTPEEPLPAIIRPPKVRTEPKGDPESMAPEEGSSPEQPVTAKGTAWGQPAKAPSPKIAERAQGEPTAAEPPKRAIKQGATPKRAAQKGSVASDAMTPGASPRQSKAEEAAAEKPAAPVQPPATPVPTLQRPTTAPAKADPPRAAAADDVQTSTPGADAASDVSSASSAAGIAAELRVTPDAARGVSGIAAADVAARSAEGEEDMSSSAAAAGAVAGQRELPQQAAARQLTDSKAVRARGGSVKDVSGAAPTAPLEQPLSPASKPVRPQPVTAASRGDVHKAYDAAMAAFMAQQPLPGVVTQLLGTSGVIVCVQGEFRGLLPWSKLLARRQAGLLERERASWAAMEPLEDKSEEEMARAQLRRSIMGTIVEQRVMVYVHQIQPPAEGTGKVTEVLLSERGPVYKPDMGIPPYVSEVLEQMLGERVECTVAKLMRYGVFLNFAVKVAHGCMCEINGLMHHSKMGRLAAEPLQERQNVTAYIAEVDAENGRVQLSAEPPKAALPLNQTLEDLLRQGTSEGEQSDQRKEAMPEAMEVCRELLLAGAITEAQPGRRLQGRAFSPEVQVFMAKGGEEMDSNGAEGEVKRYTLLARARNEVQEIDVESPLDREEMKAALAQALSMVLGVQ